LRRYSTAEELTVKQALPNSRLWILDPWRDLALFILTPLWIVALMWSAKARFDVTVFGAIVLAVGGIGHHLPGFIRAYTDPVLFRRFRTRFILAPLFLITVCLALAGLQLHTLKLILVVWGTWHGAMQINGFLRIYDAKVGSISPATAWLDWAICLVWFAGVFLHSPLRLVGVFSSFYSAGGSAISPELFHLFVNVWDVLIVGVTLTFLINVWHQARAGRAPSPVKFLLMASSIGFWWFAMTMVDDLLVALVIWEVFHDIQYNALVWIYNRRRVAQGMTASPLEKFLFQPAISRLAFYTLLVLLYGSLGIATDYVNVQVPDALQAGVGSALLRSITGLFIASALLHFYFDGFIWQVREGEFRKGLGIRPKNDNAATAASSSRFEFGWLASGSKWALLIIPVTFLGVSEYNGKGMPLLTQYQNITRIVPESSQANFMLATMEASSENYEAAVGHFERAIAIRPDFVDAHAMLADVYSRAEKYSQALDHYSKAAALDPTDYVVQGRLGMALLTQGKIVEAIPYLQTAVNHQPDDANLVSLLGTALIQNRRENEGLAYLYRAAMMDRQYQTDYEDALAVVKEAGTASGQ
jgi:cytochrome c-type biogenesis protein CcmH/NrfG